MSQTQKGGRAKNLGGPINWVGQTLNWVGQYRADPPAVPPLIKSVCVLYQNALTCSLLFLDSVIVITLSF